MEELFLSKWNFNNISEGLVTACNTLGRAPKNKEIKSLFGEILPAPQQINAILKENNYCNIQDFCSKQGYQLEDLRNQKRNSFESICAIYDKFYDLYRYYPNSNNRNQVMREFGIPSWSGIKSACGERFEEFCERYNLGDPNPQKYQAYCDKFIELSKQKGEPLIWSELSSHSLPDGRWFVNHCPNKEVKNYNQFLEYIGLKPRYEISKEYAAHAINKKASEVQRNLKIDDFKKPKKDEIGVHIIDKYWGSFNNMLKELGYPINQEGMTARQKPITQLAYDIIKLCKHIEKTEGRKIISREDVNNSEWCLNSQAYDRWFKRCFGYNLAEFINRIGYESIKSGMGMVFKYEDGEIAKSKWEFAASNFLRENNINYERDIDYTQFIKGYIKNKNSLNCDYVININGLKWYVEIAGMLDYNKISRKKDDQIRKRYKEHLGKKENMLKANNLNYKIIYPADFEKPLSEVFSFLWDKNKLEVI